MGLFAKLEVVPPEQLNSVAIRLNDGKCLVIPRYTVVAPEQRLLLDKPGLELPQQPPPKIYPGQLAAMSPYQEVPNH